MSFEILTGWEVSALSALDDAWLDLRSFPEAPLLEVVCRGNAVGGLAQLGPAVRLLVEDLWGVRLCWLRDCYSMPLTCVVGDSLAAYGAH